MYRLMLVDDQRVIMEGIAKLIRKEDLPFDHFIFASSGEEALERLVSEAPDAMITDIRMPGMDGLELCRRIRERKDEFRDMPILILTGYDEFAYAREAIAQKVLFYLLKPVRLEELYTSCRMMVDVLEERKVRLSEKASHMNLREHLIRNALNPTNRTSLHEEHPEGLLLVQARSGGELRGFYQKAAELRQLLTESLYAVYVRDAEAYFLLSKKELTQMVSRDCPDLEINVSRSFYDLASLPEAIRQIYQVHMRRADLPRQRIVSYEEIQNTQSGLTLIGLQDLRPLWNAMGKEERKVREVLEELHHRILEKSQGSRSGTAALYAAVCMEIYKRYYSIPLARILKEEFDFLLHSGMSLIHQEKVEQMRDEVVACVVQISGKLGEKQKESIIVQAKDLIRQHPELSLNETAQKLHISSQYLSTLFHKETGIAFGDFLIQERMQKACHLLFTTKLTAEQVAGQVGYTSEKHFFVVFKKTMGVSPAKYRKNKQNMEG